MSAPGLSFPYLCGKETHIYNVSKRQQHNRYICIMAIIPSDGDGLGNVKILDKTLYLGF